MTPGQQKTEPATINRRRRPSELRRLLLDTGARLFAEQGYEATTYRQITVEAGVSESVLFRHFGSKAQLMVEAVAEPFGDFVDDFVRTWEQAGRLHPDAENPRRKTFGTDLANQLTQHRYPLRAVLTALQSPAGNSIMREVGIRLDSMIATITELGETHDQRRHRTPREVELSIRLIVGMVVTVTVLDDWFLPDTEPDPGVRNDRINQLVLHGAPSAVVWTTRGARPSSPADDEPATPTNGAPRRTSDEVRRALLAAARRIFADPGYTEASYRDIADAAHASESVLHRHFGTKANLLHEAVLQPVIDSYASHRQRWNPPDAAECRDAEPLVVELYRYFFAHRANFRILIGLAHDPTHRDLNNEVTSWLNPLLDDLTALTAHPGLTQRTHIGAVTAMAFAIAVLDDWFLPHTDVRPDQRGIDRPRIEQALAQLVATGRDGFVSPLD